MENACITRFDFFVPFDEYPIKLTQKDIPPSLLELDWNQAKWELISRYKFVIAMENSKVQDYVTEKLFHAFVVGSVPIYLGAPNIYEFLPSPHSAILVEHFKYEIK